jgi:hypothetical protein
MVKMLLKLDNTGVSLKFVKPQSNLRTFENLRVEQKLPNI